MQKSLHVLSFLFVAAGAAVACSSSSTGSGSSSGSSSGDPTPVTAATCQSKCEAKFTTCGAPAGDATSQCSSSVCKGTVTAGQVSCLEAKSCDDIQNAKSFADLCPAGTGGSSSGSSGSSSGTSGSSGSTGLTCKGATCDAAKQYCGLTYNTQSEAWEEGSCTNIPSACASSDDICSCLKENSSCPTTGLTRTKCSSSNGAVSFGCD